MKIKITARGIYGGDGEIPVGTELSVSEAPKGWAGRYVVLQDKPAPKAKLTADTAPAPDDNASRRTRLPKPKGD